MAKAGNNKSKGTTVSVNFEGVETRKLLPEGEYRFKVLECELKETKGGDDKVSFKMGAGDAGSLFHDCTLTPTSLWKLKATLEALGVNVASGKMKLNLKEYVGLELMGTVEHEVYNGKKKARLVDMWAVESSDDEDEEDTGKKDEDDESEDDEPEKDDPAAKYAEMDDDTLFAHAKERGVYEKKKAAREAGRDAVTAKLVAADLAAGGSSDDDEEEDDE